MIRKLRVTFICINMLIVTGMLCVILGMTYHFTARNLAAESIRMLQQIAANPIRPGRPGEPPEEIRLPFFMVEISARGRLVSTGGGYYDLSDEMFLREVAAAARDAREDTGVLSEYNLRFCRVAMPGGERFVFADTTSEESTLQNLLKSCVVIGGASFLAFLLISILLARWAVKPVETAWNQQRQFVADASHELKTPLTVILTNAELLAETDSAMDKITGRTVDATANGKADGVTNSTGDKTADAKAIRKQYIGNILTMSHQMRGLVESLLELARIDNGTVPLERTPLLFSELVSDATLPFESLYFEKGLELDCQTEDGVWVKGSMPRLRQVVEILLDNAMKYAAPVEPVTVRLRRCGLHVRLSVANRGEEIPPAELKNIFKRFYRLDKARSMNHSYGLGLSIAQSIVKEHRGKIWAESSQGVNTFFVELPLLQEKSSHTGRDGGQAVPGFLPPL